MKNILFEQLILILLLCIFHKTYSRKLQDMRSEILFTRLKVQGKFQTLPCVTYENFIHPSSSMPYFCNVKYITFHKKRDRSVIHVQIVVRHILSFLVDDQKGNKFKCTIENVQGYPTNHKCTKGLV